MLTNEQEQALSRMLAYALAAEKIDKELVAQGKMPNASGLFEARNGLSAAISGLRAVLNR